METFRTLEQFEEFKGEIVYVRAHLLSHLGEYRPMMYVGNLCFVDSCEEDLDGTKYFKGLRGFQRYQREENGKFTLYNINPPDDRSKRLHIKNMQEVSELWESRSKNSELKSSDTVLQ
ncbi:hypothetical protein J4477_04780 [Candidatus Pacearchaeota archaeon]|nr:hypothetical protein [Candidatus Pacearchaeota archaeon]